MARLLDSRPGAFFDEHDRLVGFWGMALARMPHRMHVDGRTIRAWCAWDTLFLPELIGKTATVESPCPTTGETVWLTVGRDRVEDVSPAGAVLSFLRPDKPFDTDTIQSFCHFVHFFASPDAAAQWTADNPGTFTLSIEDGYEIGRLVNRAVFGTALAGE